MSRSDDRRNDQIRPVKITRDFQDHPHGSVLIEMGNTRVICAVSAVKGVPRWMREQGVPGGWLTSEYSMLPSATHSRKAREVTQGKPQGRTMEIQRLVGRSLRAMVDLKRLSQVTLYCDCDVINADGGTRCASITGAAVASHFILLAKTKDGLTAFLYHKDQPGWKIKRRIPIMGPEEHGGHCEIEYNGLEIPDENRLGEVGKGLKIVQIRLGLARLTHCMRWIGLSKRCLEIALDYVSTREGFGVKLSDRESVQIKLGKSAMDIDISRLLVMRAAWKIEHGSKSRQDVSMAKIHVADTLNNVSDTAIQLNGAKGYSKDIILEWIYRYARQAKLVDGASEVHQMIINRFFNNYKTDFWHWGIGHDS